MLRAAALLLPLLCLACGCQSLARNVETVEYRPGPTLSTAVADRDAEYTLSAPEKFETRMPVDVAKGELVGFRREPDGSLVAIAGKETMRIEPGKHYVWLCTPKPVTAWDRFAVSAHDKGKNAVEAVTIFFLVPFIIYNGCTTGEWP
jgi:hypothetical protein